MLSSYSSLVRRSGAITSSSSSVLNMTESSFMRVLLMRDVNCSEGTTILIGYSGTLLILQSDP